MCNDEEGMKSHSSIESSELGLEKSVNDFYEIVRKDILNTFKEETKKEKEKNRYISKERIKTLVNDFIHFLHSENFYVFSKECPVSTVHNELVFPSIKFASFTLLPQKLNQDLLHICKMSTLLFCNILDNIVFNLSFLYSLFEDLWQYDEFLNQLITICKKVYIEIEKEKENDHYINKRNIQKDIRCIIGRSDYMTDITNENKIEIKQIEYNTISVSFGSLSSILFTGHKNLIQQIYKEYFPKYEKHEKEIEGLFEKKFENDFMKGITDCLFKCHHVYLEKYKPTFGKNKTVILSVLQEKDQNNHDKFKIKRELQKRNINQIFLTLHDLEKMFISGKLFLSFYGETIKDSLERIKNKKCNEQYKPGKLFLNFSDHFDILQENEKSKDTEDGTVENQYTCTNSTNSNNRNNRNNNHMEESHICEVSVVYFRSLYTPNDYNEIIWKIREMIEFSDAVKIPSIPYQLVGSKRVQMLLTNENILKKCLSLDLNKKEKSEEQIEKDMNFIKQSFALQVDPSDQINKDIIDFAIQHENTYILKPQREGGLNNLHKEKMKKILTLFYDPEKKKTLSHYVLMKKLNPYSFETIHCRTKEQKSQEKSTFINVEPSVQEIGMYHNFIFYENQNILNEQKGYLVRTKNSKEMEGAVNCGISSIDSFFLI